MEILRQVHAANLAKWAKDRPEVLVLSGDLTGSTEADLFAAAYPDRFFNLGMTEQNMMSMAGGLAREGFRPFVHTFAVFIYRRALDQLAMSVAYPNLPVRLFGFLPGIVTPGGATHQAIDDVAVMRALPNMTVIECGDATDVESVLDVADAVPGPVYVRLVRGAIPRLFPAEEGMQLGHARELGQGEDVLWLTSGIATEESLRAADVVRGAGVSLAHMHVSTLKPFDDEAVLAAIGRAKHGVITMENHTVIGGLGSAVAEMMATHGIGRQLVRLGLQDTFAHGGSKSYLMREYGFDALALVETTERLLGRNLGIAPQDLSEEPATLDAHAKAEGL